MTRARSRASLGPLAALFAAACLIAAGCDSAVVPPSTGPGPVTPNTPDPTASGAPSGVPGAPSNTEAPSPPLGIPQPATLPMSGFAAYDQVQMIGSEYGATVYTPLLCDALAGWLQAADWRLDGSFTAPLPSTAPAADEIVPPRIRWLVISRPGEKAVAKLVSDGSDTGCRASVSRLSQQPLSASGTLATTTTAMAYQIICLPDTLSVHAGAFYIGEDGTRAMISAKVPLVLGEQQLLDGDMWIWAIDFTLADLTENLAASLGTFAFMAGLDGVERYEAVPGSTGTATVTSIDPFVATITLGGFVSEAGATQSVSAGIRCDLPGHQLERAAIAPPGWSPAPTVSAAGSMSLTIGSSISENLAGPDISCSVGFTGADDWDLSYYDRELDISLHVSPLYGASLSYIDSRTEPPTWISVSDAPNNGHLDATVVERGSEVDFTATGVTDDGEEVALSATCTVIERA